MAETGFSGSPRLQKGALVQLVQDVVGIVPNIVAFQYNPEKLSHSVQPWNPFEVDQTERGSQAPNVQPFEPKQSFTLALELDATDQLEDADPVAEQAGVADRLAALRKLTLPTQGPVGDLIQSAAALAGGAGEAARRPTVPVLLFVWGPGRILPVRVTSFSVEESLFSPTLHPIQANVSLGLEVLTPDVFKCQSDPTTDVAVAAYRFTRLQEDALALASIANNGDAIRGLLPF
jgi:hypothetical protein